MSLTTAEAEGRERGRVRANPPWMVTPPPFMFDQRRRRIFYAVLIPLVILIIGGIALVRYFDPKEVRICLPSQSPSNSTKMPSRFLEASCASDQLSYLAGLFLAVLLYSGVYEYEDDESKWLKTRCWWICAAMWLMLYMVAGIFILVMKMAEWYARKRRENPHWPLKILSKRGFWVLADIVFLAIVILCLVGYFNDSKETTVFFTVRDHKGEEIRDRCFKLDLKADGSKFNVEILKGDNSNFSISLLKGVNSIIIDILKGDSSNLKFNYATTCGFIEEHCAAHKCPILTANRWIFLLSTLSCFAIFLKGSWGKRNSVLWVPAGFEGIIATIIGYMMIIDLFHMIAASLAMMPCEVRKIVQNMVICLIAGICVVVISCKILRAVRERIQLKKLYYESLLKQKPKEVTISVGSVD